MSLDGVSVQQAAVTFGSRIFNLFQNRYVAGGTLVVPAAVSFIASVLLADYMINRLPDGTKVRTWLKKHDGKICTSFGIVGAIAISVLLAKVLKFPMSWKPVVGIPVVVSGMIIAIFISK